MIKTIRSFKYALNGLKTVWREERNFKILVIVAVLMLISIFYFGFNLFEAVIVILAIVLVLFAEIVNTAVEDLCNKIEPNQDETIRKVKDMMSGSVFVVVFGALSLGVLVFYYHFL